MSNTVSNEQLIKMLQTDQKKVGPRNESGRHFWQAAPDDAPDKIDISTWSLEDVQQWLEQIGLSATCDCHEAFRRHHITGPVLLMLTEDILKEELGITVFGQRKLILLARDWLAQRWHKSIDQQEKDNNDLETRDANDTRGYQLSGLNSEECVRTKNNFQYHDHDHHQPHVDHSQHQNQKGAPLTPKSATLRIHSAGGNLTSNHLSLLRFGILSTGATCVLALTALLSLRASTAADDSLKDQPNPWILFCVLAAPLFHFWMFAVQKITET